MSNTLVVTNTNDSGAGSLREAIGNAESGDTIKFAASLVDRTITLNSEILIPAGKNLSLDGQDAPNLTISGNERSRIFSLESTSATPSDLTVKNLTLANGYTSDRGGAISATHQGTVNVENVDFENNVAEKGGGAIFTAFEGNLTVKGSRFEDNQAIADNDERGGGAIAFWGPNDLTVIDSEFVGNEGINGGAINSLNGNMTIQNSQFIDNQTTAASYDSGDANPYLRGYGGAIFADRASASDDSDGGAIEIFNSTFEGNQGKGEGGAAYLYTGGQDRVEIAGTVFEENQVSALPNGGNDGNGGGVVVMSNEVNRGLNISDSSFVNNIAANQGGGVWMMNSPTQINNVTFSGNRAESLETSGNGGAMALYGQTEITNSTIAYNYAGWVGGGVSADDSPVSVKNTIFYLNTADNGTQDWGIQQHTNRALTDNGNNIQYLPKQTENYNDTNATESITIADPKLGTLKESNGLLVHEVPSDSAAAGLGASAESFTASATSTSSPTDGEEGASNESIVASSLASSQGSGERDSLSGGADNVLVGGMSSDSLIGDAQGDRFILLPATQSSTPKGDFSTEDDTTLLSPAIFGDGLIASNTLITSPQTMTGATDRDDRLIYDRAEETGSSPEVQIATPSNFY
jgi:predicted outer membrane repeat protein